MTNFAARKGSHKSHLLALEPRMMFDAAAAVTLQNAAADQGGDAHPAPFADRHAPADAAPHDTAPHAADAAAPVTVDTAPPADATRDTQRLATADAPDSTATTAPHDVIFIDTSVDDYRQLASEWAGRGEIVLIDGTKDGIAQMQSALAGQTGIAAIHIVSHGEEGAFFLGTTRVDAASIGSTLSASLGQIGQSLAPGGDILIYGCDFAAGTDGAQALAAFADATHADVAASTDTTGAAAAGGDWVLESHKGAIQAHSLDGGEWAHTLNPNTPVPISVTADSLTVTDGNGNVVVSGTTGYGSDARSPDVGVGSVAVWKGAATYQGQSIDLRATVVSLSTGDAIRFNRPTGTGANGDDPTFLLRDLTTANDATVQIRWDLVVSGTNTPLPADVRFTILDIDGIGGNPNTRESVTAATTGLAYYTRENVSDINFVSSLDAITASGTQNENTVAGQPLSSASAATFDWSKVSSFTLTYKLTTNTVTTQAQFYQDGDADFGYTNPVYVSIPRLDLDGNDSTATGNDAHFTFTENGPGVPIADSDIVVSNPMDINSITGGTVRLTNYQAGDTFTVGTLPSNITASVGTVSGGALTITLSGTGSETDYAAAFRAISFSNTSDTPSTVQRVIDVSFSNDTLTSAVATSRIDVIPVNDAPTARNDTATTPEDTAVTIAVLANDTDPEGDALTVTSASALHGTVVRNADGTLTYTPGANYNGTDTISYAISDGHGGTSNATVAVTITPVNDAPTRVGTLPARSTTDAATVSYATAGAFTDVDGDTLTYSATGLPTGLTINATTGVISGTIDRSASQTGGGTYAVVVTARDPSNASTTQSFSIAVTNPAPTATDDSASTNEDTPVTIAVLANDHDPDGDPLTVTTASALHGGVTINADGTLRYGPTANYNGSDTITYTISDGQGGTSTAHVAVTINPVNDAPTPVGTLPARATTDAATVSYQTANGFTDVDGDTLTYSATGLPAGLTINATTGVISGTLDRSASQAGGGNYAVSVTARDPSGATATQGFAITVTNPAPTAVDDSATTAEDTPVTIAVLTNDSDPDGDPLTVTGASALHGGVTINADGTLRYAPTANYNGNDTITYTISDGQGGTSTAHVAVTITPVNDAPTRVGTLPARATTDAATVSYQTANAFTDVDGDTLTYSASGLPAGLTINASTGVISGTLDRSASQSGNGRYNVVVTARDPSGATATQGFAITVTNPAPTARDDSATTAEDTPVTIAVLTNDSDPDGDPLSVTGASALHGAVTINADGTLRYAPASNYNGSDTITYTISDGQGGTSTAHVAVTITPVNDAPTPVGTLPARASTDAATVSYPTAGGFTDVDGDTLTYSASGLPAGLTIDANTGVISGTIDRSASQTGGGNYSVSVSARDPSGATATQGFTLTATNPAPTATDDATRTHADTPVTINVLANDRDPDGDPLTVTSASAGQGSVTINADGTLRYVPAPGFEGRDTITYTISDGQGGTASAIVTVDVANAAPTADPLAPVAANDGQAVTLPLGPNFHDADGDTLTYSANGLPPGLTIDPATGTVSGTIDRSASQTPGGVYDSIITADDGHGGTVSTTLHWTVANPAPVARDDTATLPEDGAVTIPVLANDSDPDGDPLTVTAARAGHGTVTINPDGTLTYRPAADYNGPDTITYTIDDGQGGTATAHVSVTVSPVNDAPAPVGTLPPRDATDAATVSYPTAGAFTDVDGDTLTYTATGLPAGLSIDANTGVISGTIDRSASQIGGGTYAVTVTARDPSGETATQGFTLAVTNPAPVAADDAARTHVDTPVTIAVLANDSDPDGDPLTVTGAAAQNGTVTIAADGTLRYTPAAGFTGRDTIAYTISDGQGGTASATVTIDVGNAAPTADPFAPVPANDGATVNLPVAGNFHDADGDPLTYSATGLPPGLSIDPATGVISGTIDRSASQANGGAYNTVVTADDGHGGTVSTTLPWTVSNLAPIAHDDAATTPEDTPIAIVVLANDSDPDGDPLTVVAASAGHGSVSINPDGSIVYRPDADFNGTDAIAYTISDGQGGRATGTVAITVTPVNDAPRAVAPLPALATADAATVTYPTAPAFTDVDGDTLSYTATGLPAGLAIDPATGVISGTLDRSASQTGGGAYAVTITAHDPSGETASQTLAITVTNPAPVAADDTATTAEDTPVTIPVLANDRDPDGDPLTVTGASAAHGTVSVNPDGTLRYTPDADFNGTDTIAYTVSDGEGGTASAHVAVTVTPVNDAPVAVGTLPPRAAGDGEAVSYPTAGTFTDRDGDTLTYSATGLPAGLSIDPATGIISGTIDRSASQVAGGVYNVTVTARDPSNASAVQNFGLTVANAAPVAVDDVATTMRDVPATIDVLANDRDPNGDPLAVTGAAAAHGTVSVNPDGTLRYTPAAGYVGADTIAYTVSDGKGGTASGHVAVNVTPVNTPPVATGTLPTRDTTDAATVSYITAGGFADADGDVLHYTATGLPAGLSIDANTGVISGTVDRSASQTGGGTYTAIVTARDAAGGAATQRFVIDVHNPAPIARDDAARTAQNGAGVTIAVLANDSDPDGDPLTVVAASAGHGTATIAADGTVRYVAAPGFTGTDTIHYTISDGQGGVASANVTVIVDPVDRAPIVAGVAAVTVRGTDATIDVRPGLSDPDGDPVTVIGATSPVGTVTVNPDGTFHYVPSPGFEGTTVIDYTVSDGRGGTATGTVIVRVRPDPVDIGGLLRIGAVRFERAAPVVAPAAPEEIGTRNPLVLLDTAEQVRSLGSTAIGDRPVLDAVESIETLRGTGIDPNAPIAAEVARLDALRDQRDAGDRLFDHRWGDFMVKGFSGFSQAADRKACVMVESVVRGHAIYVEVRDTAEGGRAAFRSVELRMANGGKVPAWIKVDPRGLAIIERGADMDELHLVVRVTRTDGATSATPIVIQGETGEVELDRHHAPARRHAAPLDVTLQTPSAALHAEAVRLARHFQ